MSRSITRSAWFGFLCLPCLVFGSDFLLAHQTGQLLILGWPLDLLGTALLVSGWYGKQILRTLDEGEQKRVKKTLGTILLILVFMEAVSIVSILATRPVPIKALYIGIDTICWILIGLFGALLPLSLYHKKYPQAGHATT